MYIPHKNVDLLSKSKSAIKIITLKQNCFNKEISTTVTGETEAKTKAR